MMDFMRANWGWMLSFGTFIVAICTYIYIRIRALQLGIQALLRAQMISEYYKYVENKIVPLNVKDNFENLWVQYEKLGKNGVMSSIHSEFMNFQTKVMD